jgi:hypothetical protein
MEGSSAYTLANVADAHMLTQVTENTAPKLFSER